MAIAPLAPARAAKADPRARWLQWPRLAPWLIVLLGLLTLLPGNHLLPLVDRDEPRFAQAAREMRASGDYIVPTFDAQFRFDKPPLTYWLMIPCYKAFGENEFAARFPSVIAALLIALVLYRFGRRLGDERLGLTSAVVWLTLVQVLIHGRAAVADMPMVLAVLVAMWALYELLCGDAATSYPWRWWLALYGALGVGFLAKGPIAWAVPALALLLFRGLLWRRPLPWARLKPLPGLAVVLAIIAPWGIAALVQTHGDYWRQGMQHHVVDRGLGAFGHRSSFIFYYLGTAFLSLFPWIAYAGDALLAVTRRWGRENAFLVCWLVAPYVIFTPYATQLPHYVMPGFPAFCLILGQVLTAPAVGKRPVWSSVWFWGLLGLVIGAAVLLGALAAAGPWPQPLDHLRPVALAGAGVLVGLAMLPVVCRLGRWPWVVPLLAVTLLCLSVVAHHLRQLSPAVQLQAQFALLPPGTECLFQDFTEPSVVFYSGQVWRDPGDYRLAGGYNSVPAFLRAPGNRAFVAEVTELRLDKALKWLWRRAPGATTPPPSDDHRDELTGLILDGYVRHEVSGLNLARSSWVTVAIYYRVAAPAAQ